MEVTYECPECKAEGNYEHSCPHCGWKEGDDVISKITNEGLKKDMRFSYFGEEYYVEGRTMLDDGYYLGNPKQNLITYDAKSTDKILSVYCQPLNGIMMYGEIFLESCKLIK